MQKQCRLGFGGQLGGDFVQEKALVIADTKILVDVIETAGAMEITAYVSLVAYGKMAR